METFWEAKDVEDAKYHGTFEFQSTEDGEWHNFEVVSKGEYIVFGSACNTGLLQSGYIKLEEGETIEECLDELHNDLIAFYDGGYHNRIIHNERM